MSKVILRGDAVARAKTYEVTFSNWESGDQVNAHVGNKTISYVATSEDDAADGLTALINASKIPEFQEFSASADGAVMTLVSRTAGKDMFISFTTGDVDSGTVTVTEITPGAAPQNEVQKIELDGAYTSGNFQLQNDFGSGTETTGNIAYDATGSDVKTAIVAGMASVTAADVNVTGPAGGPWFAELKGAFAESEVSEFSVIDVDLAGTNDVIIETIQNGFGGADTVYLVSTINTSAVQNGVDQSGTFKLAVAGESTAAISFNQTPAAVQSALEGLSVVGAGNVVVHGFVAVHKDVTGAVYVIRFIEDFAGTNVTLSVDDLNLAWPADVEKLVNGGQGEWPEVQVWDYGGIENNPNGFNDVWRVSHAETSTSDTVFGAAFNENLQGVPYAPEVYRDETISGYGSYDIQEIEWRIYNQGEYTLRARCFVTGGGFVLIWKGNSGTDQPEGEIGASGVSQTLDHAAGVSTVIDGGSDSQNEKQSIVVQGSGGTFPLDLDGQTTSAIAFGALPAAVQSALQALSNVGSGNVSVTGSGTPSDPYIAEFVSGLAGTNLPEMTGDGSSLTGGSGTVTEATSHVVGTNEIQRITVTATSGQWKIASILGEAAGPWDFNETAANLKSDLEAVLGAGNIDVTGSAGGPYDVEFTGDNAEQPVAAIQVDSFTLEGGGASSEAVTVSVIQRSLGPNHANDPLNWNVVGGSDRVPETGDDLVIEDGDADLLYGLNWLTTFSADAGTDLLTITDHDFADGQKVRVSSDDTLPAGLAVDTDYYVIDVDHNAIQLSLTRGGSAIDLTDAGSGTHTIAVELNSYTRSSRHNGLVGLAVRNIDAETYYEYRNRAFRFGLLATGDKKITIGTGDGSGSGREILHNGSYEIDMALHKTGGSQTGEPAFQHTGENANSLVTVYDADAGFAFHAGEVSQYRKIMQHGGFVNLGEGQTIAEYFKTDGELLANGANFSGTLTIVG